MTRLKTLTSAILIAATTLGTAYAAGVSKDDTKFMQKAAEAGMFEIQASQLAQQKASNPEVKSFAAMMIDDHTKAADQLKQLAATKGVTLPAEPSKGQRKDIADLTKKTGKAFDREYADEVADDAHKDAVKLFEHAAKDSKDPDVKAFAANTLPVLRHHLESGKALEKTVKAAGK
jgi:putative membrane protein